MSRENGKTDWSRAEKAIGKQQALEKLPAAEGSTDQQILVPAADASSLQLEATEPTGILARYKTKKIQRGAALAALEQTYDAQLTVLSHQLGQAVRAKKAHIDVMAEEFLKDLDSRHLAVLSEIGLRNKQTRENALIELTEQTVQKLKDVQERDWPDTIVDETIENLMTLRMRLVRDIMEELGAEEAE